MVDVRKKVAEITPEITQIREYIHENPELSMQEYNTCALLEDYVKKNVKYDRLKRVGETGLFFELKGTKPGNGPTIVFRGDIDALPIQEAENMSPRSKVPGVMHACGHDVHGTINVGAAKILSEMKDQFSGSIYFFIQPAEEILKGAKLFLNDPEIDFDQIDAVAALHISAELDAGTIGVRYGAILASADEVRIRINGKGGHGAHCHTLRDPVVAASAVVGALQTLVSRETNPANAVVISICTIHAGAASNIVPDYVEMTGTVRTLNPADRDRMEESVKRVAASVAEAYPPMWITFAAFRPSSARMNGSIARCGSAKRCWARKTPRSCPMRPWAARTLPSSRRRSPAFSSVLARAHPAAPTVPRTPPRSIATMPVSPSAC